MKIHIYKLICLKLGILSMAMIMLITSHADAQYRPPDMEKNLFATKDIQLDKFSKAGLVGTLVSIARDFDQVNDNITMDTRSYALAIAGRLDVDSLKVRECLRQLQKNGKTNPLEKISRERTADRLYSGIRSLMRKKDNKANQACAAYCIDIALAFEPYSQRLEKLKELKEGLKTAGYSADWTGVFASSNQQNKGQSSFQTNRTFFLPGESSNKLKSMESQIIGLYRDSSIEPIQEQRTPTPYVLKAVKDSNQKGILFQFKQPVHSALNESLKEAIEYIKVVIGKDKIPSGYKVLVSINPSSKVLVKKLSQVLPLAIAIESLILGQKIDDQYCTIGKLDRDGKLPFTGDIWRCFQDAINQNCTIIGISHSERRFFYDFFLIQGMNQILKINAFTQKNFSDTRTLSRKEKSSKVTEAISLYAEVGDQIGKIGSDAIRQPEVKNKLRAILVKAPNHLSAQILLDYAEGKIANKISLRTSMEELYKGIAIYKSDIHANSTREDAKQLVKHIRKIKHLLDPRTMVHYKHTLTFMDAIVAGPRGNENNTAFKKRIDPIFNASLTERRKITNSQDGRAELLFQNN